MTSFIRKLVKDEFGATAIEYGQQHIHNSWSIHRWQLLARRTTIC